MTALAGSPITFDVNVTTCSTAPAPKIKAVDLPHGLKLVNNGNGTATISGIPATKDNGVFTATISASVKSQPVAVQTFVVTVDHPPVMKSLVKLGVLWGNSFSYTIKTNYAYPTPTITSTSIFITGGTLPGGGTFVPPFTLTDNHNGTATLSAAVIPIFWADRHLRVCQQRRRRCGSGH